MTNQAWLPSTHIYTHYTARQDVLCALVQLTRPLQSIYCVYTLVFVPFNNLADEASFMRRKSRAVSRSPSERTRGFHMCRITSFNKRWNPLAGVEICTPMSDDYRPNAITCHPPPVSPLVSLYPALAIYPCYPWLRTFVVSGHAESVSFSGGGSGRGDHKQRRNQPDTLSRKQQHSRRLKI